MHSNSADLANHHIALLLREAQGDRLAKQARAARGPRPSPPRLPGPAPAGSRPPVSVRPSLGTRRVHTRDEDRS